MGKAARAIIIEDGKILLMHRNKEGSEYFTLVGGRVNEGEIIEQTLRREIKEETGLDIASARLVFVERHPAPYSQQYIFLCEVSPHDTAAIQSSSEEAQLNQYGVNVHKLQWVDVKFFPRLAFRTPKLHAVISEALEKGFPEQPIEV